MRIANAAITLASIITTVADAGQPQSYRPFVATIRAQYWTESGRTTERSRTFARNSNGSYALLSESEERPVGSSKPERGAFSYLFDASRRLYIMTDSFVQAAVVKPVVEEAELKSLASAYGTCDSLQNGTWTAKGRSKLLGIDVTEVEVERTGREVITAWVAPELQRFALKRTDILDGELRVREEVLSVRNAEPPASMFAQPDGYALVSPREMEDRYLEREYQRAIGLSKLEQN